MPRLSYAKLPPVGELARAIRTIADEWYPDDGNWRACYCIWFPDSTWMLTMKPPARNELRLSCSFMVRPGISRSYDLADDVRQDLKHRRDRCPTCGAKLRRCHVADFYHCVECEYVREPCASLAA